MGSGSWGWARPGGSFSFSSGSQASRLGSPWRNHRLGFKQNAAWENPLPATPERYGIAGWLGNPRRSHYQNPGPAPVPKRTRSNSATSGHAYGPPRPAGLHFPEVSDMRTCPKPGSLSLPDLWSIHSVDRTSQRGSACTCSRIFLFFNFLFFESLIYQACPHPIQVYRNPMVGGGL